MEKCIKSIHVCVRARVYVLKPSNTTYTLYNSIEKHTEAHIIMYTLKIILCCSTFGFFFYSIQFCLEGTSQCGTS